MNPNEINPLMANYRAELVRLYGPTVGEQSTIYYHRGWFYLKLSTATGLPTPYRKAQLQIMLANLRQRQPAS